MNLSYFTLQKINDGFLSLPTTFSSALPSALITPQNHSILILTPYFWAQTRLSRAQLLFSRNVRRPINLQQQFS